MTMWLMRAGKDGEREFLALENQVAVTGWEDLPDLSCCTTRGELEALLRSAYPNQRPKTLNNLHGQVWAVRNGIQPGDLVVMPLKSRPTIAIGTVTGDYEFRCDLAGGPFHARPVEWQAEVPRRAFDMDILLSFGAFMTVCRIERNDAEQRVQALLAEGGGKAWPVGPARPVAPSRPALPPPDIEERSADMIRDRIAQRFKGHALSTLVAALLDVQGYRTRLSPPGADGGVDILAGSGPLSFDGPKLVVQVKSQDTRLDVRVLRELAGVMGRYHADYGLLVGWGGFNQAVRAEAAADYFRIRLWDASDIVAAVKEHYGQLPPDIRAEIPLKQVWTLVPNEAASVAA